MITILSKNHSINHANGSIHIFIAWVAACWAAWPAACWAAWPAACWAAWPATCCTATFNGWTPINELATPAPAGAAAVPATTPTRATPPTPRPTPRAALYYCLFYRVHVEEQPSPSALFPSSHY